MCIRDSFSRLTEEDLNIPDHPEIVVTNPGPFPQVFDHIYVHYSAPDVDEIYLSISYNVDPEKVKSAYEYHVDQLPWGAKDISMIGQDYTETRYWFLVEEVVINDDESITHTGDFKGRRISIYKSQFLINVEGVTFENGDLTQLTTHLEALEKHAISIVDGNMGAEGEDDVQYFIYPGVLNRVKPGETVSFSVITGEGYRISEDEVGDFQWKLGACMSVSDYLATSSSTGEQWVTIGEIDTSTGEFTGKNIGSCQIYLYHNGKKVDQVSVDVVCHDEIPGDLNAILELYRDEIPWGPILDDVYSGHAPICFSKISPGAANNMLYSSRSAQDAGVRLASWFVGLGIDKSWKEWVERYGPVSYTHLTLPTSDLV